VLLAAIAAGLVLLVAAWAAFSLAGGERDAAAVERFMHVHGLAIPAWAPDAVYLSTHQGLIRIDEVGGWRFVSEQRHDFMGFAHHPVREGVFYSSGHPAPGSGLRNPIGFMVSEDGGATWEPVSLQGEVDFHAMTMSHADPDVVYGWNVSGAAGLYRSKDGGRSWQRPAADALMGVRGVFSLAAHPTEPRHVLAGTTDGLWRSLDGGETWEQLLPGVAVTALATSRRAPDRALAYLADGRTGLAVLEDLEDPAGSIRSLGLLLPDDDAVVHIAVHPTDEGVIYAGTAGQHLFVTKGGGGSWQQVARDGRPEAGRAE
jgi:hypothetical protein